MILNGIALYVLAPIKNMLRTKVKEHGVSHGLSEVGYDIRVKQQVVFVPPDLTDLLFWLDKENQKHIAEDFLIKRIQKAFHGYTVVTGEDGKSTITIGRTALASSIEEFELPTDLWGELRNKSTHARRFFDCSLGTDMEPGWSGFLTIEIVFHGLESVTIPAGSGIAKAVFHELRHHAEYDGKYQKQADSPVPAILHTT